MQSSSNVTSRTPNPASRAAPSIGRGRYALVAKVAEGGMAGVYRAWDAQLGAWRAIKVLLPEYANRPTLRGRFEREASTMARLSSPYIVRVFDVVHDEALPFMVMELAEGGTLVGWLDAYGRMPASLACDVVEQVAMGLAVAHRHGVVHRDVKPHNVLISLDGQCKLTDFGIAQVRVGDRAAEMTRTGSTMGTIGYMAPEQRADAKAVDHRADIYSLGALLFKLITGTIMSDLFLVEHEPVLLDEVPEVLHEIIVRACYHDRERRFPTADAFIDTLRQVRAFLPTDPRDTPPLVIPVTDTPTQTTDLPFPEIAVLIDSQTPLSVDSLAPSRPKGLPSRRPPPPSEDVTRQLTPSSTPSRSDYTVPMTHPAADAPLYASFPPPAAPAEPDDPYVPYSESGFVTYTDTEPHGSLPPSPHSQPGVDPEVTTGLHDTPGSYHSHTGSHRAGSYHAVTGAHGSGSFHAVTGTGSFDVVTGVQSGLHRLVEELDDPNNAAAQRWAVLMGAVFMVVALVLVSSTLMVRWTVFEAGEARAALYDTLVEERSILHDLRQAGLAGETVDGLRERYLAFEDARGEARLDRATDYVRALKVHDTVWTEDVPYGLVRARASAIENAYLDAAQAHKQAVRATRTPPGRLAVALGLVERP